MTLLEILGTISIVFGCVFALTGSVGVLRMPDFYARLHPAGKSDTLAQALILLGLALFTGQQLVDVLAHAGEHGGAHHHGPPVWIGPLNVMLKLALLTAALFLTAPTATHAIAKAARLDLHTKKSDLGLSEESLIAEIVVPGDAREKLEEDPEQVLDVHEDEGEQEEDEQEEDEQEEDEQDSLVEQDRPDEQDRPNEPEPSSDANDTPDEPESSSDTNNEPKSESEPESESEPDPESEPQPSPDASASDQPKQSTFAPPPSTNSPEQVGDAATDDAEAPEAPAPEETPEP